jgi:hypothetical protein
MFRRPAARLDLFKKVTKQRYVAESSVQTIVQQQSGHPKSMATFATDKQSLIGSRT